jgi:hypothetical protein
MSISLSQLLEESFQIAWEYLERTGELGDGAIASRFLGDRIEAMIRLFRAVMRPSFHVPCPTYWSIQLTSQSLTEANPSPQLGR